ncbi:hypothetical protein WUBG_09022 [Wuchereria bancrofti]|uniref:Uncharacterized protein n=1 Tax=Wuchereria bancrofti TaxID=6293 RepID=J9ED34_WUCBA|nr:hypothetical protein WUBG_09022 [Wuchereria bancrofti]VDM21480.1 unnamed protein product [Wuchereria bancrofti]
MVNDSAKNGGQIVSYNWMGYGLIYLSVGIDSSTMYSLKFSSRNEASAAKAKDLTITLSASVVFLDGSESSGDKGIVRWL